MYFSVVQLIARLLTILFLFTSIVAVGQNDTIRISGKVIDYDNPYVRLSYFVVNKRTAKGVFGDHKGQFSMQVLRKDTLIVSARDYATIKIVVRDSVRSANRHQFKIVMKHKEIELIAVDIFPIREHSVIAKEIKDLVEPSKIEKVTADGFNSPITALYQAFSKYERDKHAARVLEAEDRKADVLKELLAKYVDADIIELESEKFDEFLAVAQFDTDYLGSLSEYDLISYVQYKYYSYLRFMEFYNVVKRLYRNEYEFMLLEARNEKMSILMDIFKQFVDRDIWHKKALNPDLIFQYLDYASFSTAELIEMSDYGIIATLKRKYDQFTGVYGGRR